MGARPEQPRPVLYRVAVMLLLVAACLASAASAATTATVLRRLRGEQKRMLDAVLHPTHWKRAVQRREVILRRIEAYGRRDPALPPAAATLIAELKREIAHDGVTLPKKPTPPHGLALQPFAGDVDLVCWVEADHVRVAVANPSKTPQRVHLSLRHRQKGVAPRDCFSVVEKEVTTAPGAVTLVHFRGIPTHGLSMPERSDEFFMWAALVRGGKRVKGTGIVIQNADQWGDGADRYVVAEARVTLTIPPLNTFTRSTHAAVYVAGHAMLARGKTRLHVAAADTPPLITADHGHFVRQHGGVFTVAVPAGDDYDLVTTPDRIGALQNSRRAPTVRAYGPVILRLGRKTPVTRVAVDLPAKWRFDPTPLSPNPARRVMQLVPRLRTSLWKISRNAEKQLAGCGAAAVPEMIRLLTKRDPRYGPTAPGAATRVLQAIGRPAAAPLAKLLGNRDWDARWKAARILNTMGDAGVEYLLAAARGKNHTAAATAMSALARGKHANRMQALMRDLLSADDSYIRRQAVMAIARTKPDAPTMKALLGRLRDEDPHVRSQVVQVLVSLKAGDHAAQLVPLLSDAEPSVRSAAAEALERLDYAAIVPALAGMFDDDEVSVRTTVARTLSRLRGRGERVLTKASRPALTRAAAKMLRDDSEVVRAYGCDVARDIEVLVPELVRAGDDAESRVSRAAAKTLASMGYADLEAQIAKLQFTPKGMPALIAALGAKRYPTRAATRKLLTARGDAAVPALAEALEDKRELVRVGATRTLAAINTPRARAHLATLLEADKGLATWLAADALASQASEADKKLVAVWLRLLGTRDVLLRASAARGLGQLKDSNLARYFRWHLSDPRAEVRHEAIRAIGELGDLRDATVVDALGERLLNHHGGDMRAPFMYENSKQHRRDIDALQKALIKLGPASIPVFTRAAGMKDPRLQKVGLAAIVAFGEKATEPLANLIETQDKYGQLGAARALTQLKPKGAIPALVRHTGGRTEGNNAAFTTLLAYGEVARKGLLAAMLDENLTGLQRGSAAVALAKLDGAGAVKFLEALAKTAQVRDMMMLANRMVEANKKELFPAAVIMARRPDTNYYAVNAVYRLGGARAKPVLEEVAKRPGVTAGVRRHAERMLRNFKR